MNVHKVSFDIQLEDVTPTGIIARHRPDAVLQPENTVVGPSAGNARITVADERWNKQRGYVVIQQVMNHPVAELRGEHLAHLGVMDDEAGGRPGTVPPGNDCIPETEQFSFQIALETQLIVLPALMPAGILVSLVQVSQQLRG